MKKYITTFLLIVFFGTIAVCQDTLRTLDGEILDVKIERISEDEVTFSRIRKSRKTFSILEKEVVFSYTPKGQSEVLIYQYNPEIGNIYELNEMRDYMKGGRHARNDYNSILSTVLAFSAGVWAGSALSEGSHVVVAVPLVFSSILMIPGSRVKKNGYNENYLKNKAYKDGYKRVANGKKFLSALKYSGLGMLGSFFVFNAID